MEEIKQEMINSINMLGENTESFELLKKMLIRRINEDERYITKPIGNVLNGLTGIDRKFKEAELDAEFNAMSDHYEQEENQIW